MLRLFTGIAMPDAITSRIDEFIAGVKPLARIRWSPAANFHITTKFIGAWPEDRLDAMKQTLTQASGGDRFRIAIHKLGFYPNAKSPRVFWTGIDGGPELPALAARTDEACSKLGVEKEARAYSPHLTLARIDGKTPLDALRGALAKNPDSEFGEFEADRFHLYLSKLSPKGSVYTSLAEFPL